MFGKKEEKKPNTPEIDIKVVTIPRDFYAGANPTVKFKEVEQTVDLNKLAGIRNDEKKALHTATAAGGPANLLSRRSVWVAGGIGLFVLFAIGAGFYYWWQSRPKQVAEVPAPIISTPPKTTEPITTPTTTEPTTTTTPEPEIPVATELAIDFPSKILAESADLDGDKVSDLAEDLYATDPGVSDTDKDKYTDGHELYYLYNPNGIEPQKLIDSGFVRNFTNPSFGYETYYPTNWALGTVDTVGRQILFSTLTGENIEVRTFDLPFGQTLSDWFVINAPKEEWGEYEDIQSRFGANAKMRKDGLVYLFYDATHVFALVYHATDSNVINYKIVLQVMARSFKIGEPLPPTLRPVEEPAMTPETMPEVTTTPDNVPVTTSTADITEEPTGAESIVAPEEDMSEEEPEVAI